MLYQYLSISLCETMSRFTLVLLVLAAVITANFASAGPAPSTGDKQCGGQCDVTEDPNFALGKCERYYCACHIFNSYMFPIGAYTKHPCGVDEVFYKNRCVNWYEDPEC